MTSFYTGSGCEDVESVVSFLGVSGHKYLSRPLSTESEDINTRLVSIYQEVIADRFKMEIASTIHEKLRGKYTKEHIEQYIQNFNETTWDVLNEIITLGLAVSNGMGWK